MTSPTRSHPRLPAAAVALAALAMIGGLLASPLPGIHGASPASAQLLEGPGYRIPHDFRVSMVGAYRAPDGALAYCLEWGQESPTLATDPAHQSAVVTQYANWSAEEVARVNWLIGTHGQHVSNEQAAAVGVAIWLRHPGDTADPFRVDHPFFIAAIPDSVVRAGIVTEGQRLSALMDGYRYLAPAASGELQVMPDADDAMRGEIVLSGVPAAATGVLSVTGAQLTGDPAAGDRPAGDPAAGGSATAQVSGDMRFPYRLTPSDAEIGRAEVAATVDLRLPGGSAGPALRVWQSDPALQDVAAVGPVEAHFAWQLRARGEHSLVFSPVLTTQVPSRILAEGEPLADTVQLSLAEGSAPWRWFTDGSALPITVVCRAYGPLAAPPAEAAEVPTGTPLATEPVRVQVGGGSEDPLAAPVSLEYALVPEGGGYYTSVCGIDAAEQADARSPQGLPMGYRFSDAFGLAAETQFSPVGVRFDTTLSDAQVHPGASIVDVIVGEATGGPWAEWEGERVRVPLVGTVYWSGSRPDRATTPPEGAEAVLTLRAELTEPGTRAEALIDLPDRPGWYTVRWCTNPEASAVYEEAPLVRLWCDDYGVPSETVHAVAPTPPAIATPPAAAGLALTGPGDAGLLSWTGLSSAIAGLVLLSSVLGVRAFAARRGSPGE